MSKPHIASVGPAIPVGITVSYTSANRCFPTGSGTLTVEGDKLPWENANFVRGLLLMAIKQGVAHAGTSTVPMWQALVIKTGTPDSKYVKLAEKAIERMEENGTTWEAADEFILGKYGRKLISHDLDGFIDHFIAVDKETAASPF